MYVCVFCNTCNTFARRLISLHCATTDFWPLPFFCFCFYVAPSAAPCFASCRQTFYFVIFLPQAAANATQIKHATFFILLPRPFGLPLFFHLCRLTNCAQLSHCSYISGPLVGLKWSLGHLVVGHPVIKHPLISCFYLHIHAAHSQLNWQPGLACTGRKLARRSQLGFHFSYVASVNLVSLQPVKQQQKSANRIINIQRAFALLFDSSFHTLRQFGRLTYFMTAQASNGKVLHTPRRTHEAQPKAKDWAQAIGYGLCTEQHIVYGRQA